MAKLLILLCIVALAGCDQMPATAYGRVNPVVDVEVSELEQLNDYVYRFRDNSNNVVCYSTRNGAGGLNVSCVKLDGTSKQ
jgi:hypothetical protein